MEEKKRGINKIGIFAVLLFVASIFVPYVAIDGVWIKIFGTNYNSLHNIGMPGDSVLIFQNVHEMLLYVLIGIAVVLLIFSLVRVGIINILLITIGIIFSILFIIIDAILVAIYSGGMSSQDFSYIFERFTPGITIFLITLGFIMMVATGIAGNMKNKKKNDEKVDENAEETKDKIVEEANEIWNENEDFSSENKEEKVEDNNNVEITITDEEEKNGD